MHLEMKKFIKSNRVMEAETISKNGRNPKSLMSRGKSKNLFIILIYLFAFKAYSQHPCGSPCPNWTGSGTINDKWDISDYGPPQSGNVHAYVDGSTLYIEGTGNMADFWCSECGEAPWNPCFYGYDNSYAITVVTIQENVTNIGDRAFKDLSNLQSITIPNTVEIIGKNAFEDCKKLTSITIPESVKEIEGQAFFNCSKLEEITIEKGDNTIYFSGYYPNDGSGNYDPCHGTWGVRVCDWFKNCQIKTLYLGCNTFTWDESYSPFYEATLNTLIMKETVSKLGVGAFASCLKLETVEIKGKGECDGGSIKLGENYNTTCFDKCPIKTLYLGKDITSDSHPRTFQNISDLINLTIGCGVTSIPENTFSDCDNLPSVVFPNTMSTITSGTFSNCIKLNSIDINSIATIGSNAFSNCGFKKLNIPVSVSTIGYGAFADCKNLIEITIVGHDDQGSNIKLGENYSATCFAGCPIETLYLGKNIADDSHPNIFSDHKLTLMNLTFGPYIGKIQDNTFSGCSKIEQISSNPKVPPTIIDSNTFKDVKKDIPVYINCDYLSAYKNDLVWGEFTNYQCAVKTNPGDDYVVITFPKVDGAESYTLCFFNDKNYTDTIECWQLDINGEIIGGGKSMLSTSELSCTIPNLTPKRKYYYKLSSYDTEKLLIVFTGDFETEKIDGINENTENHLIIFPNPANHELKITNYEGGEIEIYDIMGKTLMSLTTLPSPETTIDVSHLPTGMYFLKIDKKTAKFVKE